MWSYRSAPLNELGCSHGQSPKHTLDATQIPVASASSPYLLLLQNDILRRRKIIPVASANSPLLLFLQNDLRGDRVRHTQCVSGATSVVCRSAYTETLWRAVQRISQVLKCSFPIVSLSPSLSPPSPLSPPSHPPAASPPHSTIAMSPSACTAWSSTRRWRGVMRRCS